MRVETPSHYIYHCFSCGKEYSPAVFEVEYRYLCPACGKAQDNLPLTGVMQVIYDYDRLRRQYSREKFLKLYMGRPWLYPDLWPLGDMAKMIPENRLEWLALPDNLLLEISDHDQKVLILDDTRNPTFSFKDRASILVAFKAIQMGITDISVASTGNAGSSLAGICARLGLRAHVWVPERIPPQKLLQIQGYGADIHLVSGSYDQAFDLNRRIAGQNNWYDRNTAYNPLTVEGKKSAAYDMFIAMDGNLPGYIFVPVGDGAIMGGLFKGFTEMLDLGWIEVLPKLIGVQAGGSDALVRFMESGKFEFREASTVADSICAGAPRNLYMAAEAIRISGGEAIRVKDEEIFQAQSEIARNWGYLVEPSAAVTWAGYRQMRAQEKINTTERSLLMFTGNGLKDMAAIKQWCPEVESRSADEWMEHYGLD